MGGVASECLQKREQRIGRAVAAGLAVHRGGPGERLFLDLEIGVHVDLCRLDLLMLDMRVIWRPAARSCRQARHLGFGAAGGDAVGAERRSPEGGRSGALTACAPSGGGSIVPPMR